MSTTTIQPVTKPSRLNEGDLTHRDVELGAIIDAYNQVTEKLKGSHEALTREVRRLRGQVEEKNRELERRERLAALGEMAAGVAHEVRNPLGGILLYATMLERDLDSLPESQRVAARIASAARGLDAIVGDILAFANPQEPKCRPVRVAELLSEAIELLKPRWVKLDCTVEILDADAAVMARVEPTQIMRVMLNVLSNAIDAAGESGHVWVRFERASPAERFVQIRVADDGPGVPRAMVQRIFNPFFTTKDSGTGLGLAIVHRVLEAHGGEVVVGDRPGGGAVFTLSLPAEPTYPDCEGAN